MIKFHNWRIKNVARLTNVDGYENMSWQQLENTFTMLSASVTTPIPISAIRSISWTTYQNRPRLATRLPSTRRARPRLTPEHLSINMDELEKVEMTKTRSITENTW